MHFNFVRNFKKQLTQISFTILGVLIVCFFSLNCSNQQQSPDLNELIIEAGKLLEEGKISESEKLLNTTLSFSIILNDSFSIAKCYKIYGNIYSKDFLNLPDSCYKFYGLSENILQRILNKQSGQKDILLELANVKNNIAVLNYIQSDFDEAIRGLKEVLSIDSDLNNTEGMQKTYLNLGKIYCDKFLNEEVSFEKINKENLRIAKNYFSNALTIKQNGDVYLNLGRAYHIEKQTDSSLFFYNKAQLYYQETKNAYWYGIATGNIGLLLYDFKKNKQEAIDSLSKALKIIENVRSDINTIQGRSSFLDDKNIYYEKLIQLFYENKDFESLFVLVEKTKVISFREMINSKNFIKTSSNKSVLFSSSIIDSLSDIQKHLDDSTSIVEFFIGSNFSCSIFINKKKLIVEKLLLNAVELKDSVDNIMNLILNFPSEYSDFINKNKSSGNANEHDIEFLKEKWNQHICNNYWQWSLLNLYGILFSKKISAELKSYKRLIIIPHSFLHNFPFSALITSPLNIDLNETAHIVQPKFFIQEKEIVTMQAARLLKYLLEKNKNDMKKSLLIGNPGLNSDKYEKLQWAEKEVKNIASYFSNPILLLQQDAKESTVKKIISNFNLIHFAAHGEFFDNIFNSRILLSEDNTDDGFLSVQEIINLNLNANLVVLNICQSSRTGNFSGTNKFFSDDIISLAQAFIYAGATNTISTLWSIDDKASAYLINEFYKNIFVDNYSILESLNKAQLKTLYNEEEPDWKHPYFWAPFIFTGKYK